MNEFVLIDTSAWIEFFRNRDPVASLVDDALTDGSAALCGVIDLEIRQGLRSGEEDLLLLVGAMRRIQTEELDFALAGDLLANLRHKGITIPGTDGLIAHLALRHDVALLEFDGHFEHVPGLVLQRPRGDG